MNKILMLAEAVRKKKGFSYLLRDEFITSLMAGSINGTPAEPGPGIRTVVDTGNNLSIATSQLITSGVVSWGDPRMWYNDILFIRTSGRMLFGKWDSGNGGNSMLGWARTPDVPGAYDWVDYGFSKLGLVSGVFERSSGLPSFTAVSSFTHVCVIHRATGAFYFSKMDGKWLLSWHSLFGSSNEYVGINTRDTNNFDFIRVPDVLWLPVPFVSDGFSISDVSDGLGHPEVSGLGSGGSGISWAGAPCVTSGGKLMSAPIVTMGSDLAVNGGAENGDPPTGWSASVAQVTISRSNTQAHSGTYSCKAVLVGAPTYSGPITPSTPLTVGKYYKFSIWYYGPDQHIRFRPNSGILDMGTNTLSMSPNTWTKRTFIGLAIATTGTLIVGSQVGDCTFYLDDFTCEELSPSCLNRSINVSTPDVLIDCKFSVPTTTGGSGFVLRLDDVSNPQNFIRIINVASDNRMDVYECVSGVSTKIGFANYPYNAEDIIRVVIFGNSGRLFSITPSGTVADRGPFTPTLLTGNNHGVFVIDSPAAIDDFVLYPIGMNGEYSGLDRYID